MKNTAKLRIIFHDDRVKHVRISLDCSTEILMSKIEKWEYRPRCSAGYDRGMK